MRTVIAIFLLFLFTAQTELGQLFRLPFAVQHYVTHQQQNQELSLLEFLQEHYNAQHEDADAAEDRQLPFKNYNPQTITEIYVKATQPENFLLPVKMFQKPFTPFVKSGLCQRSFAIFHPPQAV